MLEKHVNSLRFYSDSKFEVTEDLKNQIVHDEQVDQIVHKLHSHRKRNQLWEIEVEWEQFEDLTWQVAKQLYNQIPDLMDSYIESVANVKARSSLKAYVHSA